MKVTIEFDTDNAAFEDNLTWEIREVMKRAEHDAVRLVTEGRATIRGTRVSVGLRDTNGNTIGKVEVSNV